MYADASKCGSVACFSFKEGPGKAHEFHWIHDEPTMGWYSTLPGTTVEVKFPGDGPKKQLLCGYINTEGGFTGPPVIVVTKRYAKKGAMDALARGMDKA